MLVIVSDLHLTDGSDSANISETAFSDILLPKIVATCEKKQAREVHLVFLGDIFDLVRTDYWVSRVTKRDEKPWNSASGQLDLETALNPDLDVVERHYGRILKKILATRCSREFFHTINTLGEKLGTRLPVRATFVIGNHDRPFFNFTSLPEMVKNQINPRSVSPVEFSACLRAPAYDTLARHGHEWDGNVHGHELYARVLQKKKKVGRFDPACYRVQAIGEVITSELVSGFIHRVKLTLPKLWPELKELHKLGNLLDVFYWLDWFTARGLPRRHKDRLVTMLMESIAAVLDTDLARLWDRLKPDFIVYGDLTDYLSNLSKIMHDTTYEDFQKALPFIHWFEKVLTKDRLREGAWQEFQSAKMKGIQYIFYGHTHEARQRCFEGRRDGSVREYINTGTFLPVIQRAQADGFFTSDRMTMVFVFRPDEDVRYKETGTVSLDVWNGWRRRVYPRKKRIKLKS